MDKDSRTEERPQASLGARAARVGKWSALSQVATKLVSPVTTMLLARLLTPADFGVVASVTMITSLADLFTDAGFQQYIIQRKFYGKRERDLFASVAFWTNLALSLALVAAIIWLGPHRRGQRKRRLRRPARHLGAQSAADIDDQRTDGALPEGA